MGLEIQSVHKRFGEKEVLSGINISIEKGTFLALLGPSGCGKTTLLQSIAGLTSIDSGTISIDGTVVSQPGKEVPTEKRNIGMVFQDFALWPHMNVFENVSFGLKLRGVKGQALKQLVMDTLAIFHMEDFVGRYPHELSGGQKQRIAMARAIAPEPRLILMDEPLSSLDAGLREEMRIELVRIFKQLGMTVVYVTHDQMEALSMADQIVVLKAGQCEQMGAPESIYHEPVSEYVAKFMGPANVIKKSGHTYSEAWFIRPDDIVLSKNDIMYNENSGNHNNFQILVGTVISRIYLGNRYRYQVEVEGFQAPFEVSHVSKLQIGDQVNVGLPSEKRRVLQNV